MQQTPAQELLTGHPEVSLIAHLHANRALGGYLFFVSVTVFGAGCGATSRDHEDAAGAGTTGSGASGGADGGAGAGGSAGDGGAAGSPATQCSKQIGMAQMPLDPKTRGTIEGANGTFTDECNAEGNLIEYQCAFETVCGGMECAPYPTGQVLPSTIDCNGACQDGVCDGL